MSNTDTVLDDGELTILHRLAKMNTPDQIIGDVYCYNIGNNEEEAKRYQTLFDTLIAAEIITDVFKAGVYADDPEVKDAPPDHYEIHVTEHQLQQIAHYIKTLELTRSDRTNPGRRAAEKVQLAEQSGHYQRIIERRAEQNGEPLQPSVS
ncbi:MAG: hypothetical protein SFX19_04145 [Alphaproteobacteria bacterium]|nr:hypothetical protein [Alphaproteobacteria bacterium]